MSYAFDTSPISTLFRNYYRGVFKTLWRSFDTLIADGDIISTREVRRELEGFNHADLQAWLKDNPDLFPAPTGEEAAFVVRIFGVSHFQNNIEGKKLLRGGLLADPFIIARAAVAGATVVTVETLKPGAADIPNICHHFKVPCISLEQFMEQEGWTF